MSYVLKPEELSEWINNVITNGSEKVYEKIRERAWAAFKTSQLERVDEVYLDIHDDILQRVRLVDPDTLPDDQKPLYVAMYDLVSMFRTIAHELHIHYFKKGISSDRFLEQVASNAEIKRPWLEH